MKTNHLIAVGCNYWASHAGIFMWQKWDAQIVEDDLKQLAAHGMKILRIFPLWSDFQPVVLQRRYHGIKAGIAFEHGSLPDTEWGRAGIDPVMMERFRILLDLAAKYDLKVIIGLITGWMSGRLFAPRAFENLNLLTDPFAIHWEILFVRAIVRAFKDHPAIESWDLGNECNCLSPADSEQAWVWNYVIKSAIREEDPSRPVVSGMHNRNLDPANGWNIPQIGENNDVLTTHPYPLFTEHVLHAPFYEFPATLQATAETLYAGDLAGKPCFIEEAGSLGPMITDNEHAAKNMRTALYSALVHGIDKYLWWCAFDQNCIEESAPYEWTALERRLGLFSAQRVPAATALEMKQFAEQELPFDELPARKVHAVVLLSNNQEYWRAAYGAMITAKRAGYEVKFARVNAPLPESDIYLLPCVSSPTAVHRRYWLALLEKVKNGAKLLVTWNDAVLEPFESVFGCHVQERVLHASSPVIAGTPCPRGVTIRLKNDSAEVLESDNGFPVISRNIYGKGMIEIVNAPIEYAAVDPAFNYEKVYSEFFRACGVEPVFEEKKSEIGVTEHIYPDGRTLVAMINYSSTSGRIRIRGKEYSVPGNEVCFTILS